jgi:trk system potassium uptake protein TrkH
MKIPTLITATEVRRITALFLVWLGVVIFSWIPFVLYGYPCLNSLFDVVSALTDAGLTTGIANESLPTLLKLVILFDMLFGKFVIVGLLIISLPKIIKRSYHKHHKEDTLRGL